MDAHIEELFSFYALGMVTEEEKAQVEAYVAADADARKRLEEMVAAAQMLPYEATPVTPSPSVKEELMSRVNADIQARSLARPPAATPDRLDRPAEKRPFLNPWWSRFGFSPALGLVLLVAILAAAWALSLQTAVTELRAEVGALQTELGASQDRLAQLSSENEALQERLSDQDQALALFASPEATIITLASVQPQIQAEGKLVTAQDNQTAVLLLSGLGPAPADTTYQFWLIQEGMPPVSAGTFNVAGADSQTWLRQIQLPSLDFTAVGLSIEPQGGSEQPTNVILLGELTP